MLKKNSVPVEIKGELYEIVINIGSMLDVEELTGQGFMEVLMETEKGKLYPSVAILSCCLREVGSEVGVGIPFIKRLENEEFQTVANSMIFAITNSLPQSPAGEEGKN